MKVKPFLPGDLVKSKCGCIGIIDNSDTNNWGIGYKGAFLKVDKSNNCVLVPTYSIFPLKGTKVAWFNHEELTLIESNFSKRISNGVK